MSYILGIIKTEGDRVQRNEIDDLLRKIDHGKFHDTQSIQKENTGFGAHSLFTTEHNKNKSNILYHTESNILVCADISLYNRRRLIEKLGKTALATNSDIEILLKAYLKWGHSCVYHLLGDFAFAIYNFNKKSLFCARDHMGVRPFYYSLEKGEFRFSSNLNALPKGELDRQWIADLLSKIPSEKDRTMYSNIYRLPPAHTMTFENGELKFQKYWELTFEKEIRYKNEKDYVEAYREKFSNAVGTRILKTHQTACELSGGIDSTSITGIASGEVANINRLHTFSHALNTDELEKTFPYKDERAYIEELKKLHEIENHTYITATNYGIIDSLRQDLKISGTIPLQNLQMVSDCLYTEVEKSGTNILLSGFGGDEMITSKAGGIDKQLFYQRNWKELKTFLTDENKKSGVLKLGKLGLKTHLPNIYQKLQELRGNRHWIKDKYDNFAFNPDFVKEMNILKRMFKINDFSNTPDLRQRQSGRINHNHISHRLEYCQIAAHKYGIEYRYPMLDIPLMEFYYALPWQLKRSLSIGRFIHRKGMEGILPKIIQWRNDKTGATVPHVLRRVRKDKEQIFDLIETAKTRGIAAEFIDFNKLEKWADKVFYTENITSDNFPHHPNFLNYLKLIIYLSEE